MLHEFKLPKARFVKGVHAWKAGARRGRAVNRTEQHAERGLWKQAHGWTKGDLQPGCACHLLSASRALSLSDIGRI